MPSGVCGREGTFVYVKLFSLVSNVSDFQADVLWWDYLLLLLLLILLLLLLLLLLELLSRFCV
jgi:hypothetical protein